MKNLLLVASFFSVVLVSSVSSQLGDATCVCPRIYAPVCASDDKTYGNVCDMNCHSSQRLSRGLTSLRVLRTGRCDDALEGLNQMAQILNEGGEAFENPEEVPPFVY